MTTTRRRPARKVAGRPRPDARRTALDSAAAAASKVDDLQAKLATLTWRRNQSILEARNAGCTWREVAASVGLTEMGVRKIYERTEAAQLDLGE